MTDYDPTEHKIDDIKEYVGDDVEKAQAVLDAEKARGEDARSTLVSYLEDLLNPKDPPAPEVTDEDEDEAEETGEIHHFFGKDYERTPEGGFRQLATES